MRVFYESKSTAVIEVIIGLRLTGNGAGTRRTALIKDFIIAGFIPAIQRGRGRLLWLWIAPAVLRLR